MGGLFSRKQEAVDVSALNEVVRQLREVIDESRRITSRWARS